VLSVTFAIILLILKPLMILLLNKVRKERSGDMNDSASTFGGWGQRDGYTEVQGAT